MFKDLKVLELASVLAGPSVGQFFAELGADVIKVENLKSGGDVTRTWKAKGEESDDRSAYFCAVNWGKRSIAIDLESPEGKTAVHALARTSDVVIASYKPGDAEKLLVDYKTLSSINKNIIYGQITGYGSHSRRVGYDAIIQAEAGFMYMNGEPGGASLKMPVALMDVLAAHQLKEGLLLALIRKLQSGEGSFVEVSLIDSAISALVNQATNWLMAGILPEKKGSAHPNIAPYGDTFVTLDNKEVLLAVGSDRQFVDLCVLLDLSSLSNSVDYINNRARVLNRETLHEVLQEKISKLHSSRFIEGCNARNIPAGVIHTMRDVFEMPGSKDMLFMQGGIVGLKTLAITGDLPKSGRLSGPPHFGEHTLSILRELGLSD